MNEPPWLAIARAELGRHEVPGPANEPRILEYHQATTLKATSDAVPWCSAYACFVMTEAGLASTGSAAARSWLAWGRPLKQPVAGCIAVFSRPPDPASGHVGFYLETAGDGRLMILGGNQGDAVSIRPYPRARLLGFRWPAGVPIPA